jgi:hypothetical protein
MIKGDGQIQIVDMSGKTIYSKEIFNLIPDEKRSVKINENLKAGVYLLQFTNESFQAVQKLVKL